MEYLTVRCAGYINYCDALIARLVNSEYEAFFLSLVGTPSHIQASSAILFGGETCRVHHGDETNTILKFSSGAIRTYRNRKIGNTVNKIMINVRFFMEKVRTAIIFGPNLSVVQERAFLCFDAATTIPLKPEWQCWLWDEILQPEKLYSFGSEDLREAYLINWSEEATLEKQILEGVKLNYLS